MAFSNSALVNYTKISPNKTTTNRMPIDRITIHHAAGNILIESMGTMFANPSQRSSSNYGIGTDGRIAMYVEECHSSWCSSSTENDKRAVTIEVANSSNTNSNWPVSDKALDSTIKLCADICKRNGKSKAVYFPTLAEANAYKLGTQEMLFTRHDFYKIKNCLPIDDTELLTRWGGWVSLRDIKPGDLVATAHIDDFSIKFSPVLDKVEPYVHDTYIKRDLEATADHRVIYMAQNGKKKVGDFKDIFKIQASTFLPQAGYRKDAPGIGLNDDQIKLLIAVQADGHYRYENRVKVNGKRIKTDKKKYYGVEFHFSKDRKIKRIQKLLDNCKYDYKLSVKKDGTTSIRSYDKNFLKFCMYNMPEKTFPWHWIDMSPHQAKVFLDEILFWDGSIENKSYFSRQKENRDVVCAIATLNGVGVKFNNNDDASRNTEVSVTLKSDKRSLSRSEAIRQKQKLVSCVTVESGFILIRQKRRTTIVGNCPGPYLGSKLPFIVSEVNKILSGGTASSTVPSTPNTITTPVTNPSLKTPYIVRVKANGLNIRSGPGTSNSITGCIKDNGVYTIINEMMVNNKTPWGELKLGGWICVDSEYVDKLRSIEEDSKAENSPIGDPVDSKPGIGIDEIIWLYFQKKGFNDFAIAGILGNLFAESGLSSINLQNAFESKLGMTDEEYTAAVDNGSYTNFDSDGAGYGIAQWTYSTRKQGLKTLATLKKTSVGDLNLQLEFLFNEITSDSFRSCYDKLMAATSLEDATYTFLLDFEKPANAEQFKVTRLNYAKNYYNKFNTDNAGVGTENKVPYTVRITANELNIRDNPSLKGNKVGVITDHGIYTIIEEKLNVDGYNWGRLKSGAGWIALNWIEKV